MNRKLFASTFLILVLSACSAPAQSTSPTSAPQANQQQAAIVTATSEKVLPTATPTQIVYPVPEPAVDGYPAPAPAPAYPAPEATAPSEPQPSGNPLADSARFKVAKVDAILDALLGGKGDTLAGLIVTTSVPCTLKSDTGGFPKCDANSAEGTMVDALPTLHPLALFMPKSNDLLADMVGQVELMNVFSVKADAKSEQYLPVGKYGITLRIKKTVIFIVLRVSDDGIVRADYLSQSPDSSNQPDLDKFVQPQ